MKRVRDIPDLLSTAFARAKEGVPGPVFLELPVDALYDETLVREWFEKSGKGNRFLEWYMRRYLRRLFDGAQQIEIADSASVAEAVPDDATVRAAAERLRAARRPVIVAGSQAASPGVANQVAGALSRIGVPVYLSGMARGILGAAHPLHLRHRRKEALREADLVILAGVPADFRLNYGRDIARNAAVISANRSAHDLKKNRKPSLALQADPALFLIALAQAASGRCQEWIQTLQRRDEEREAEVRTSAEDATELVNPVDLCRAIDHAMAPKCIVVADGGDFVSTASYIVHPRAPLSWLDPGAYGTLGVGGGFAIGAGVSRPDEELWILYGDGALGFSIAEFDTFARHRIPVIAVVANDGCWSQIHREQVDILGDDTGCMLARTDYHIAAEGLGGRGLLVREPGEVAPALQEAKRLAAAGSPVLVNVLVGKTAFRKGSISM